MQFGHIYSTPLTNTFCNADKYTFFSICGLLSGGLGCDGGGRQEGNGGENIFSNLDKCILHIVQIHFVIQTNTYAFILSAGCSLADWGAMEVVARRAMEGKIVSNFSKRLQQGSNRVVPKNIFLHISIFLETEFLMRQQHGNKLLHMTHSRII